MCAVGGAGLGLRLARQGGVVHLGWGHRTGISPRPGAKGAFVQRRFQNFCLFVNEAKALVPEVWVSGRTEVRFMKVGRVRGFLPRSKVPVGLRGGDWWAGFLGLNEEGLEVKGIGSEGGGVLDSWVLGEDELGAGILGLGEEEGLRGWISGS